MVKNLFLFFIFFALSAAGQTRNSAKTKDFPIPLNFDVVGHGVDLPPLLLEYDMESSQGESLMIGNIKVSSETFFVNLVPAKNLDSRLSRALPKDSLNDWVFLLQWPEYLMEEGVLELISRTGRILWKVDIDQKQLENWTGQLDAWKEILLKAKYSKEEISKFPLFKIQYGLRHAESGELTPFWSVKEPFRFCFSRQTEKGQTRLCTSQYEVIRNKKQIQLALVPLSEAPPRVILMNEVGKLANRFPVPMNKPIQFYAELKSGLSYEFVTLARKLNIVDSVQDKTGEAAWITIESDMAPLTKSTLLNKEKTPEWIEWIGWQQTIGDFRKYWRTKIPLKDGSILMPGLGGGAFRQDIVIHKLPKEEMRPYLHYRTKRGTYVDGTPLRGRKLASVGVSSRQNSVESEAEGKNDFTWSFSAKEKGDFNRSYLLINDGEDSFPTYFEMYKGYSTEISSRLTGIVGTESGNVLNPKLTIMGEVAVTHWFESLLGWQNYWVSKQRWGTSLKAFRSFTDIEISNSKSTLTAYTAELKYRIEPGLWGRDETWGVLGGYQNLTFDVFKGEMVGVGVFWARSMPRVFEPLMNWLSFFDYPKWVDMEFIFYPQSLNQNVLGRAGAMNWSLNFHGQIMFTDYFFGEAGFGIKQYDVSYEAGKLKGNVPNFNFTASYGTMGLGFKF